MRPLRGAALTLLVTIGLSGDGRATAPNFTPVGAALIQVDWQEPPQLPAPFRNHCSVDRWSGRLYCSNHCGMDYQFYFCTPAAFGCCHIGHGYCDWDGRLRCAP